MPPLAIAENVMLVPTACGDVLFEEGPVNGAPGVVTIVGYRLVQELLGGGQMHKNRIGLGKLNLLQYPSRFIILTGSNAIAEQVPSEVSFAVRIPLESNRCCFRGSNRDTSEHQHRDGNLFQWVLPEQCHGSVARRPVALALIHWCPSQQDRNRSRRVPSG